MGLVTNARSVEIPTIERDIEITFLIEHLLYLEQLKDGHKEKIESLL